MVVEVLLPGVLREHAGGAAELRVDVRRPAVVRDVLGGVAASWPALGRRLCDDTGALRRYVNVFVDGTDVRALDGEATAVRDGAVLHVLASVAGG